MLGWISPEDIGAALFAGKSSIYAFGFAAFALIELSVGRHGSPPASVQSRGVVNFGLPLLNVPVAMVAATVLGQSDLLKTWFDYRLFELIALPWGGVLVLALIARTLIAYLLHRLNHAIPLLWRLHRIHHSDPTFDLSLSFRHHPLEVAFDMTVYFVVQLWLGIPLWAVGIVEALLILFSMVEHLDLVLPQRVDATIRRFIVTPSVHRMHHSAERSQTDSNFGAVFTFWDRLFGTYRDPDREAIIAIGLADVAPASAASITEQLILPFRSVRAAAPAADPTCSMRESPP